MGVMRCLQNGGELLPHIYARPERHRHQDTTNNAPDGNSHWQAEALVKSKALSRTPPPPLVAGLALGPPFIVFLRPDDRQVNNSTHWQPQAGLPFSGTHWPRVSRSLTAPPSRRASCCATGLHRCAQPPTGIPSRAALLGRALALRQPLPHCAASPRAGCCATGSTSVRPAIQRQPQDGLPLSGARCPCASRPSLRRLTARRLLHHWLYASTPSHSAPAPCGAATLGRALALRQPLPHCAAVTPRRLLCHWLYAGAPSHSVAAPGGAALLGRALAPRQRLPHCA